MAIRHHILAAQCQKRTDEEASKSSASINTQGIKQQSNTADESKFYHNAASKPSYSNVTKDNRPNANSQARLQDNQWNINENSHINALLMNLTNSVAGIAKEIERLSALINKNAKNIEVWIRSRQNVGKDIIPST